MAIQLGQFKPLEHKHYTLAKTQGEYDEDAKREMAIDNNNFANQAVMANMEQQNTNNRTNAAIMEQRRQDETSQINKEFDQQRMLGLDQANAEQQNIDNAYREKQFALTQGDRAADNRRADAQLGLSQAKDSREQEIYNQAMQEKQQKMALAQFGSRLLSSEPDDNGRVDVTDSFDTINTLTGGGMDKAQFKRVFAQNTGDKTILMGEGKDGKPVPVTRNGSPVSIHNDILKKSAMFAGDKDDKESYDFKTMRAGMDKDGNVLPDRIARMNPRTGEVEFIDQSGQGAVQTSPQMSDEEKLAKLGRLMSQAGSIQESHPQASKQPGLGDAQTNKGASAAFTEDDVQKFMQPGGYMKYSEQYPKAVLFKIMDEVNRRKALDKASMDAINGSSNKLPAMNPFR